MEGHRVRTLYETMGRRYGVSWKGRSYDKRNWSLSNDINRAISAANACFNALVTSSVCPMGYLPQLGFIHVSGTLPFVYDIADIYKPVSTLPAAFETIAFVKTPIEKEAVIMLKQKIEEKKLLKLIPKEISELMS